MGQEKIKKITINLFIYSCILLFFGLILQGNVVAKEYNFENSEKLKDLIEWRDYSPDVFSENKNENKPVFLLLTAPTWCYWCQVYESEDYLFNSELVDYINKNTIPVYVDADKRVDLTRKYLEGGWPSTTILFPSGKRIYGFSGPRPPENIIANLRLAAELVSSGEYNYSVSYDYEKKDIRIPTEKELKDIIKAYDIYIFQVFDKEYGGFGTGQKFPQGRTLDYALEKYEKTNEVLWLNLVELTLNNQYTKIDELETNYNLFDPVEGGFHRYGTKRDWTPPHYEKMLYDNALLLRAYFHLLQIAPNNVIAQDVVYKTLDYIEKNWYAKDGGFYGNTDVNGEDEYYWKNPRIGSARVEKTKYTDWNSEAIITYLYIYNVTGEEKYKDMAKNSLDFYSNQMLTPLGTYHYVKEVNMEKGVRGSLLDNSYLLLAFVNGYEILGEEKYLNNAKMLADYSLDKLYDWNSGGFFERNSPDKNLYAPGENIDLSKPIEENGIMVYALLMLYDKTGKLEYLSAAVKTFGAQIDKIGGLDSGYYYVKSAQQMLSENLLDSYMQSGDEIQKIDEKQKKDFWLSTILSHLQNFSPSEQGLQKTSASFVLFLLVALIAGFISFISPCTLPVIPAFVAYSLKTPKKRIFGMSVSFFLGLSILFTLLGLSASFIGLFIRSHLVIFSEMTGILVIIIGVYIMTGRGFRGTKMFHSKPTTYIGSFFFGMALALSWTPCVGPILVSILLLASNTSSSFNGGVLLFVYSIGFALPLFLFSAYLGKLDNKSRVVKILRGK